MISAVNGRKRALLTKSALEWHNKRCTAQSTLCVGNKKGKTELKAMCDFKKKKSHIFFLVSRYLGHDTIHVSPAQVSRCIDASMHRYALSAQGSLHSTRRSRRVYADIYAISVAYHSTEMDLFYIPRRSLRIRIGCGLLANDNPASTPKRRRIVGVFTLGTCAIPTA